jgi:uncharacterized protein involved in exopolysaccharide biosynthesis
MRWGSDVDASSNPPVADGTEDSIEFDVFGFLAPARARWKAILVITVLCGIAGYGASFLLANKYTASTLFIPPHGQQSNPSTAALAQLGALSGLIGSGASARGTPDEYISMMGSSRVSDHVIQKFDLQKAWGLEYRADSRKRLLKMVAISAGKKDNLMTVEVTDTDPVRAAAIANQYVEELRVLTSTLALTEAQQRRVFFERLLEQTRDNLATTQAALEGSGFNSGALNAQPNAAAEGYARLLAQRTAAEVRLQVLRKNLADSAPDVQQAQEAVSALATQINKLESQNGSASKTNDYINRYRAFKYQETLFELFQRQYETARVDESHDSPMLQVIDPATPPERRSGPGRTSMGAVIALLGLVAAVLFFGIRGRHAIAD